MTTGNDFSQKDMCLKCRHWQWGRCANTSSVYHGQVRGKGFYGCGKGAPKEGNDAHV